MQVNKKSDMKTSSEENIEALVAMCAEYTQRSDTEEPSGLSAILSSMENRQTKNEGYFLTRYDDTKKKTHIRSGDHPTGTDLLAVSYTHLTLPTTSRV